MVGKDGCFVHCLKTRAPDLWGECNNIHLSIVLRDWPVGLPLSWQVGVGLGDCGGYMLVTMETHVPVDQRETFFLPTAQWCAHRIAGTLTCENSSPQCSEQFSRQQNKHWDYDRRKKHAKAQVPTNWTQSWASFLLLGLQGKKKRSISTNSRVSFSRDSGRRNRNVTSSEREGKRKEKVKEKSKITCRKVRRDAFTMIQTSYTNVVTLVQNVWDENINKAVKGGV